MTPEKAIEVAIALHPTTHNGQTEPLAATVLAALAEQGYVIVRAEDIRGVLGPKRGVRAYIEAGRRLLDSAEHPAQPSGTLQDSETSGPGIHGPIGNEKPAASLSGAREEILRKHLDIVVRTRAASRDGSKLTPEALTDFVDQLIELIDMSEKGELV